MMLLHVALVYYNRIFVYKSWVRHYGIVKPCQIELARMRCRSCTLAIQTYDCMRVALESM